MFYFPMTIQPLSELVVKEDSTVTKRKVLRGQNVDGYVQILEGLTAGEVVVTEGMLTLYEGAKVRDISGNVEFKEEAPAEGMGAAGGAGAFPPQGDKK